MNEFVKLCYDDGVNSPQDIRIHIAPESVVKTILILAAAALVWYLRDVALILLTAVVIASAMEPGIRGIIRWGLPRVFAVIIMYALVALAFGTLIVFFLPLVLADIVGFLSSLPSTVQSLGASLGSSSSLPLSGIVSLLSTANLMQTLQSALESSTGSLLGVVSAIFGGLVSFGLIVVLSFYFCVQDTGVENFLRVAAPPRHHDYIVGLWKRAQDKIGRWMQGQLLLGFIVGVLLFLGLTILQVPFALLLAVTAALCELIPVFGQLIAMIPGVALAFGAQGATLAILTAGLYLVVQQFEAHLIYPLVVRKIVGVPPLLVILALIVGGELAGFLGILLSVPIATAVREMLYDIEQRRALANEQPGA